MTAIAVAVGLAVVGAGVAGGGMYMKGQAEKEQAVNSITGIMGQQGMTLATAIQYNLGIKDAMEQRSREMRQGLTNVERNYLRNKANYLAKTADKNVAGASPLYAYLAFTQSKMIEKGNVISNLGDGAQIRLAQQAQQGVNATQSRINQYQGDINNTANVGFRDRTAEIGFAAAGGAVQGAKLGSSIGSLNSGVSLKDTGGMGSADWAIKNNFTSIYE